MTRQDLVCRLAGEMDFTLDQADRVVLAFTGAIMAGARAEGRVVIQGFATFTVKVASAKWNRAPNTRERVLIPAKKKLCFRPARDLRALVNNGNLR